MFTLEELNAGVVLPINKPYQWTSFQVVNKIKSIIRRTYQVKNIKIGHAGTLDPLATGLLLICIGKATKQISALQEGIKGYDGTIVLGATTPCYDLEQAINQYYPYKHITDLDIQKCCQTFIGKQQQIPPIYSAVKIDGQRAYTIARTDSNQDTIKPREIEVFDFVLKDVRLYDTDNIQAFSYNKVDYNIAETTIKSNRNPHLYNNPQGSIPEYLPQIDFSILCSKGTYIRSIARDFGQKLGSGAFLSSLNRTRIGDYTLGESISLDDVSSLFTTE